MITAEVKYKKTGIDWIPAIPEHWGLIRLRFLCLITTGKKNTENKDEEGIYPFFVRSQTIERINSYSYECEGILTAGDGVGVGKVFHYVNEKFDFHQRVYLLYNFTSNINGKFLFYYLQTFLITELMRYNSKSTVDSIRLPILKDFFIPIPPLNEQVSAIEYIDSKTEKITRFIQTKQRFIELLKEQRQSIITNAVTKGIDENVKMKETGIEWIGQVPVHWEVSRLKFLGESIIGLTYNPTEMVDKDKGILVLRSSNIQNGRLSLLDNVYVRKKVPEKLKTRKGDILLCSRNGSAELIGKNILIDAQSEGQTFGAFMTIFRSPLNEYLYYFFNSNIFLSQTFLFGTSTVNQLTNDILSNLVVAFPIDYTEQIQIIEHIKTETHTLDIAISKAEREIELIKEYREALIAEAVTGKMELKDET